MTKGKPTVLACRFTSEEIAVMELLAKQDPKKYGTTPNEVASNLLRMALDEMFPGRGILDEAEAPIPITPRIKCRECGDESAPHRKSHKFPKGEFDKGREVTLHHIEVFICACGHQPIIPAMSPLVALVKAFPNVDDFYWVEAKRTWQTKPCEHQPATT